MLRSVLPPVQGGRQRRQAPSVAASETAPETDGVPPRVAGGASQPAFPDEPPMVTALGGRRITKHRRAVLFSAMRSDLGLLGTASEGGAKDGTRRGFSAPASAPGRAGRLFSLPRPGLAWVGLASVDPMGRVPRHPGGMAVGRLRTEREREGRRTREKGESQAKAERAMPSRPRPGRRPVGRACARLRTSDGRQCLSYARGFL